MANLTATTPRTYQILPSTLDYPIAGTATIYEGSALSDTGSATTGTGVAETLLGTETFLGFASQTVLANSGITTITANVEGVIQLAVTGVTAASTGATVYASDGNTFTTTSTSNSAVGKVIKVISGTTCLVKYQGLGYRSI
jgi:hypothetical protein